VKRLRERGRHSPSQSLRTMNPVSFSITPADLTSRDALALISALNQELLGTYTEPGATHFRLDPEDVTPGRGIFLVVRFNEDPVGCGALRVLDADTAELKRMYIEPSLRGKGLGRRLVASLEAEARTLGVQHLVLETGVHQTAALLLYEKCGFAPIPLFGEYCLSPDTSICLGKDLT
jgi:putative acetyltransferase